MYSVPYVCWLYVPKCPWLYPLFSYVYSWLILSLMRFSVGTMHSVPKEQAVCMEEGLDPQKYRHIFKERLYGFLSWKHFCLQKQTRPCLWMCSATTLGGRKVLSQSHTKNKQHSGRPPPNTRPQKAPKLFWPLACVSPLFCKSLPGCVNLPLLGCSVPRVPYAAVDSTVPAVPSLPSRWTGSVCRARLTHFMCCNVKPAQSCPAISRLLKLNPLCFHTSCSVCILGCGKDSPSTYQTQLFCTWKAHLSIIFICPSMHTASLWVLLGQQLCPHCRIEGGCRDTINLLAESLHQLHFNRTRCTIRRHCLVQPYAVCLSLAIIDYDS